MLPISHNDAYLNNSHHSASSVNLTTGMSNISVNIGGSSRSTMSPIPSTSEATSSECEVHLLTIFRSTEDLADRMMRTASDVIGVNGAGSRASNGGRAADLMRHCQRVVTMNSNSNAKNVSNNRSNNNSIGEYVEAAVCWLAQLLESQEGRCLFVTELNKFRSTQVRG